MKAFAGLVVLASLLALAGGEAESAQPQTFIVYICGRYGENLCGIVPETGQARQLTFDGDFERHVGGVRQMYRGHSLSPDGRVLSFAFAGRPYLASQNMERRIQLGEFRNVAFTSIRADRRRIAVGTQVTTCGQNFPYFCKTRATLYVATTTGMKLRRIPRIYHTDWAGRSLITSIGGELWSIPDRPSREARRLISVKNLFLGDPAVSPDKKWVAVRARGRNWMILVLSLKSHRVRRLTTGRDDMRPAWSPDGKSVVFMRGIDLYVVAADGRSRPRSLGVQGGNPSWGMRIAE